MSASSNEAIASQTGRAACANALSMAIGIPGPRGAQGIPVYLSGHPGIGKTAAVEAIVARRGGHLEVVILSQSDPTDVAGIPVPDAAAGQTSRLAPDWVRRARAALDAGLFVVILLDEFSCASPATQAAALDVITHRRVAGVDLLGAALVLAGNPEDTSAGGFGLAAPAANRFAHIEWEPFSAAAWGAWIRDKGAPAATDGIDAQEWARAYAVTAAAYARFLQARPELMFQLPADEAGRAGAWASPRSHEMAVLALAGCVLAGAPETLRHQVLAGCVGTPVANEAIAFTRALDLPDPDAVLAGTEAIATDRLDRIYAALSAVSIAARDESHPDIDERLTRAMEVFKVVALLDGSKFADAALAGAEPVMRAAVAHAAGIFGDAGRAARINAAVEGPLATLIALVPTVVPVSMARTRRAVKAKAKGVRA